jgi:hypothetical protein
MSEILIYQTDDGQTRLEVQMTEDTVWLSLNQLTELFQRDKSVISRHIEVPFEDQESELQSVVASYAAATSDGCKVERELHSAMDTIKQLEKKKKGEKL